MVPIASHLLSEFSRIVLDALSDQTSKDRKRKPLQQREYEKNRQKEYRRQVAVQLRAYWKDILKDEVKTETKETWSQWIDELGPNLDKQRLKCLQFTRSTINDFADREGDILKAMCAHYRLHMHVFENQLSYAEALDDYVFGKNASPFDEPIFAFEDHREIAPSSYTFAEIDNPGWTQSGEDAHEYELAAKVRYRVHSRVHKGRDLQYGLKQAYMKVEARNFNVTREFCSFLDDLRGSYRSEGNCEWYTQGPCDNKNMLRGFAVAGQICVVEPVGQSASSLRLRVTARPSDFSLHITDIASGNEVAAGDHEKANLIRKLFAAYLKARIEMDDGDIVLSEAVVTK
jgi:hypothetical protein